VKNNIAYPISTVYYRDERGDDLASDCTFRYVPAHQLFTCP